MTADTRLTDDRGATSRDSVEASATEEQESGVRCGALAAMRGGTTPSLPFTIDELLRRP